jgi:hypothetical protein
MRLKIRRDFAECHEAAAGDCVLVPSCVIDRTAQRALEEIALLDAGRNLARPVNTRVGEIFCEDVCGRPSVILHATTG